MSGLADTSILVDYLRGVEGAGRLLREAGGGGATVSSSWLTRVELAIGTRRHERRRTDALIATVRWLPVDAAVAEDAEALARRYGPSHCGIDAVD